MTNEELDEVRGFLRDNVSSFEELEILLFFARAPRQPRGSSEVSKALELSEEAVESALAGLSGGCRLLEVTSGADSQRAYRYCAPADTQQRIETVRKAYEEQRVSILRFMSANALERVRSAAASRLAEAFRLERGKK